MKESMQMRYAEIAGILVLAFILFKNLQPFEKTIAIVCLGYWIFKYWLQFFRGFLFMAKMLSKAIAVML